MQRLVWGLSALCALLLIAGIFGPAEEGFVPQAFFGFYALLGLLSAGLLLIAIGPLRDLLMRPEDYYDR